MLHIVILFVCSDTHFSTTPIIYAVNTIQSAFRSFAICPQQTIYGSIILQTISIRDEINILLEIWDVKRSNLPQGFSEWSANEMSNFQWPWRIKQKKKITNGTGYVGFEEHSGLFTNTCDLRKSDMRSLKMWNWKNHLKEFTSPPRKMTVPSNLKCRISCVLWCVWHVTPSG